MSLSYSSAISSAVTSCLIARLAHRSSIATSANLYLLLTNADLKSADMFTRNPEGQPLLVPCYDCLRQRLESQGCVMHCDASHMHLQLILWYPANISPIKCYTLRQSFCAAQVCAHRSCVGCSCFESIVRVLSVRVASSGSGPPAIASSPLCQWMSLAKHFSFA